jgi:hypothetical protein
MLSVASANEILAGSIRHVVSRRAAKGQALGNRPAPGQRQRCPGAGCSLRNVTLGCQIVFPGSVGVL